MLSQRSCIGKQPTKQSGLVLVSNLIGTQLTPAEGLLPAAGYLACCRVVGHQVMPAAGSVCASMLLVITRLRLGPLEGAYG